MTEQEFLKEGSAFLDTLFEMIERTEPSLTADLQDKALLLENEKGEQYLIHLHRVLKEIWISSPRSGAHHFKWDKESNTWVSTRNSSEKLHTFVHGDIQNWIREEE